MQILTGAWDDKKDRAHDTVQDDDQRGHCGQAPTNVAVALDITTKLPLMALVSTLGEERREYQAGNDTDTSHKEGIIPEAFGALCGIKIFEIDGVGRTGLGHKAQRDNEWHR